MYLNVKINYLSVKIKEYIMKKTNLMVAIAKLNSTLNKQVGNDIYQYGITPTEFNILSHLYHQGKTKTQTIGEIVFISSGAITYMINKLVQKGFVSKEKDLKDKRITWLQLTDAGNTFYVDMYPKHLMHLDEVFSSFSNQELKELFKTIRKFDKKLQNKE